MVHKLYIPRSNMYSYDSCQQTFVEESLYEYTGLGNQCTITKPALEEKCTFY